MKELKVGKISNQELAEWFGIKPASFSKNKATKLEELKLFADYEIDEKTNKIIITKVISPIYQKLGSKTYQKVKEKVDEIWDITGLDTCSRVGSRIHEILVNEDANFNKAESTVEIYTRKGRNELYGTPFSEDGGPLGRCIYVWCKRDKKTGDYSPLNKEEIEIKNKLQTKYFGDTTEKQILVKAMIEAKEIREEDAWRKLEEMTNMKNSNFLDFLGELQEMLGCQIVRGTLVERNVSLLDKKSAF